MDPYALALSSPLVHAFTNTPLTGTRQSIRGRHNRLEGARASLMVRFGLYIRGNENQISLGKGGYFRNAQIRILGSNNTVIVGDGVRMRDTTLWICANHGTIHLRKDNILNNCELGVEKDGGSIVIGEESYIGGFAWLGGQTNRTVITKLYTANTALTVGNGCIISDDVTIRTHDSHFIFDADGRAINDSRGIVLGDRCWIASGVFLLKGAALGDDCIVGARSLLSRDMRDQHNVILAGTPARVVKEGITWKK